MIRNGKALLTAGLALLIGAGVPAAAEDAIKVGVVDLSQAINATEEGKAAREELNRKRRAAEQQVQPLDNIDTDLELPLSERYFLGGLGSYQLRGYRARSVGPRRSILQRTGAFGLGSLFTPVGRTTAFSVESNGDLVFDSFCNDQPNAFGNQGDSDGKCNSIFDTDDFEDLDETDVIGGNKFISATLEYRFPVSKELGLIGIVFLDMGNAFDETQNLWDVGDYRFGTGIGALWFSPFGPLQAFLGFPIDKLSVEESIAFEFSVGGQGF